MASRSAVIDPIFFPAPSGLLIAGRRLWVLGELPAHLNATLFRMLLGMAIGGGCGILVGIAMGSLGPVRRSLEPLVSFLYVLPKISLLPLFMLVMGLGESPKLLLICLAASLTMVMQTMDAVRNIPKAYLDVARNCGAGPALLVRRVYLPGALPQIFTGLRQAFGRVLVATISVELVTAKEGIGAMIYSSWQTFSADKLYLGIALTGVIGAIGTLIMRRLEALAVPWRPTA